MGSDNLDLVTVLETSDTFALSLAKSALEDAGINYLVSGDDPRYFSISDGAVGAPGIGQTPLWRCSCIIQVPRECEAEARALLEFLENPPAAESGAESGEDS
ncbi:MAG TPA: DUF2007 domain-containing protein [Bryobacteraceae bacterium]|nr:DUF2007 domain-containing protein [Bryobacteraceae bacterium]